MLKEWQNDLDYTGIVRGEKNPTYSDFKKIWPKRASESGLPYQLSDFKLVNLLYRLRNVLVY
ncbi:hypothetical protein ACJJIW_12825 [Microbulbifer sp. JMSA004]|uniref:hypothetical protein n=1 Tax=Microbulbifer sp. JMSA004 TaxID=3243370 RepID=UPI00403A28B3